MWGSKFSFVLLALCIFSVIRIDIVTQAQSQTDTIVYAMPYDFQEYSVYTADSYATAQWVSAVYVRLLKRSDSANSEWIGDMAIDLPTISNNRLTFTFTLRNNLYFSNRQPLTSDDVEFSMKVAITPDINLRYRSPYSKIYSDLYANFKDFLDNNSFTKINDLQFSITLLKSDPFPYQFLNFPLIPEDTFGKRYQNCVSGVEADCDWNAPDGSDVISAGPFKMDSINSDNQSVSVTANPYYWDAGSVKTNKIVFEKISNKAKAIASLADGSIDIMDSQYIPGINELKGISGISETYIGDPSTQELAINNQNPYFGTGELIPNSVGETNKTQIYENARLLRKAMSMIMGRQTYVDQVYRGLAQPIATQMPPVAYGFDPSIKPDAYNLTVAKDIMTSLGFNYTILGIPDSDGVYQKGFFNITVLSPNPGPRENPYASTYAAELPKIGIHVTQNVETGWAELVPRTFGSSVDPPSYINGGYDVFFVGYAWSLDWNPQGLYDSSGSCSTGTCNNFYNFDLNETMTPIAKVVREYLSTLDYDLRMQYVSELQQLLHYWNPAIPILNPISHWSWNDKVSGIDAKLLSTTSQQWENVSKTGFQLNTDIRQGKTDIRVAFSEYFVLGFPVLVLLKKMSKGS